MNNSNNRNNLNTHHEKEVICELSRDPMFVDFVFQTREQQSYVSSILFKQHIRVKKESSKNKFIIKIFGYNFHFVKEILEDHGFKVIKKFELVTKLDFEITEDLELRDYQKEVLELWEKNNGRGVIELPTGAGKTIVGLAAITKKRTSTIILVPTLTLLSQWRQKITEILGLKNKHIGILGGGKKEIKSLTVSTYQSALLYLDLIRINFEMLIADEAHHLPSKEYSKIAKSLLSRYRLGLTATPERADEKHLELEDLLGPFISTSSGKINALKERGYIAPFEIVTINVSLLPEEQQEYEKAIGIYKEYLRKNNFIIRSPKDFERALVFKSNVDKEAKKALKAHQLARKIAFGSKSKLLAIGDLLSKHWGEQIVIFCEHVNTAMEIASRFLLPLITHETSKWERDNLLDLFGKKIIHVIVTGKVLDEGWDVKSASIGILVSGTSQKRQFIQRLGRILRPQPGKKAILYEIVSKGTSEKNISRRRRKI